MLLSGLKALSLDHLALTRAAIPRVDCAVFGRVKSRLVVTNFADDPPTRSDDLDQDRLTHTQDARQAIAVEHRLAPFRTAGALPASGYTAEASRRMPYARQPFDPQNG